MNTEMTEQEILDAYQAMDFVRLTLYLLGRVAKCEETEPAMHKELDAFMDLVHTHEPGWHVVVDPISVLSLVDHTMTLLNENKLPGNLLELDEFTARNIIFAPSILPFVRTLTNAIMDALSGKAVMNTWRDETIAGILVEREAFLTHHPELISDVGRLLKDRYIGILKNNPTEKVLVRSLLSMEAIGILPPEFCKERWQALEDALNQAEHECDTCPEYDQCVNAHKRAHEQPTPLQGAKFPGAVGFSVN